MALPMLLLLASVWQMLGTSFGATAMGTSTDTKKYWQSREKWMLSQFFNRAGYTVTQTGWIKDVYQLAKVGQDEFCGNGNIKCLYAKVSKVHNLFLEQREILQTESERVARYQCYQDDISHIREQHIAMLKDTLDASMESEWLTYQNPVKVTVGWFRREENIKYRMTITFLLVCCWWVSIIGIYNKITLQESVSMGLNVLDQIDMRAWIGFFLFIILELVYFHDKILSGIKSMGLMFVWVCRGCRFNAAMETRFDTPAWAA